MALSAQAQSQANAITAAYRNYTAPKTTTSGNVASSTLQPNGQRLNSAGEVIGGAITSRGISYDGSNVVPGGANYTEKAGGAIPAATIGGETAVKLPAPSAPKYDNNYLSQLMGELGAGNITDVSKKDAGGSEFANMLKTQAGLIQKPDSKTDLYEDTYGISKEQTLANQKQAEARVSALSARLAGINAKTQTDILSLRNVGAAEGVTDTVFGSQQTRINTDAAIQAYPVAAELAAAQGDLARADKHLDALFKVQSDDLDNDFEYRSKIADVFIQGATKLEERKYNAALQEAKDRNDSYKENAKQANEWAKIAKDNGQSELISEFTSIDIKDPNFSQKFANVQAKLNNVDVLLDRRIREAQALKLESEVKAITAKTGGNPDDLTAYAARLAADGNLPNPAELKLSNLTVGQVAQAARLIPQPKGYIADSSTGVKPTTVSTAEQEDFSRLYNITQNIKQLKILENKRSEGLISGTLGKIFGAEDQERYLTLRKSIVDDMSRMQSGAALTQDEVNFYADYIPGRFGEVTPFQFGPDSQQRITDFETNMNSKLRERLDNRGIAIYGYSTVESGGKTYVVGSKIKLANGKEGIVLPGGYVNELN